MYSSPENRAYQMKAELIKILIDLPQLSLRLSLHVEPQLRGRELYKYMEGRER